MVSLGGRPWGTDIKAPVAVAVVLLAVAAWKVSTKRTNLSSSRSLDVVALFLVFFRAERARSVCKELG